MCRQNQKQTYGVARNENTEILCEVDAYPPPELFKWTFNRTNVAATDGSETVQHTRPIAGGGSAPGKRGRLSSVLTYSPSISRGAGGGGGDSDYGTVTCRAVNTAGDQLEPCVFHVIAAGECVYPSSERRNAFS